jgi:hypothetical protein
LKKFEKKLRRKKMSFEEIAAMNQKLNIGSNVSVYQLPSYSRFTLTSGPKGERVFNPSPLSKLCAVLAVANTDPLDVQRYVMIKFVEL